MALSSVSTTLGFMVPAVIRGLGLSLGFKGPGFRAHRFYWGCLQQSGPSVSAVPLLMHFVCFIFLDPETPPTLELRNPEPPKPLN